MMRKHIKNRKLIYGIIYVVFGAAIMAVWYLFWKGESSTLTFNKFVQSNGGAFTAFCFIYSMFAIIIGSWNYHKDEYYHIHSQQKERIKILDDFAKEHWFSSDKTIYNELMNMLNRCEKNKEDGIKLLMLMCSPTIDYPERLNGNYKNWGNEFRNKIEPIIPDNTNKIELKIYYLANENISGVNPLMQFIESLSGFCAALSKHKMDSKEIFQQISNETVRFIGFLNEKSQRNSKFTISSVEQPDVPFQIFIYKSKKYSEVLVSFAGKTILQDKNETKQKGFHSTDPDVVNAFEHIFNSYTAIHRRIPIKPIYSLDIIKELERVGKHCIKNYLNQNINLEIDKDVFSPAFANSSKFTSYAIIKVIKKNDKVLDIGSGTGVQAIVSYKHLKENLLDLEPIVWAIEPFDKSFENLEKNIKINDMNIVTRKWLLSSGNHCNDGTSYKKQRINIGKIIINPKNESKVATLSDFEKNKFDIVIGDLPYVDTQPDKDISIEHAFFDSEHSAHLSLFRMFANEPYIKDDSKLITSFSSLGGLDDIIKFESIISQNKLIILQRFAFNEDNYLWYVYIIVRKPFFDSFKSRYWWETLKSAEAKC